MCCVFLLADFGCLLKPELSVMCCLLCCAELRSSVLQVRGKELDLTDATSPSCSPALLLLSCSPPLLAGTARRR